MSKKDKHLNKNVEKNTELSNVDLTEKKQFSFKNEIIAPLILIGVILIFLSPLLFLFEGICADDAAFQSFPKKMAAARAFQNGEIPLWDYHEFCGGKPFYIMLENPIYNVFFYPFYLTADLNNYDQSFFVLYILPFSLLVIIAGLGAYFLGRIYFKLDYMISILLGFLWAVNPSMALSNYSTINTTVFALIPWILLAGAMFMETKKWEWWLAGAVSVALFNCAYTVNYPLRIYFTIMLIFLILSIWYFIQDKKNIYSILLTFLFFITGFLLSAFTWAHILEAAKYSFEQFKLTYFSIVNFIPNSMPPTHIINMFIPNFNGSLDNIHAWGDGLLIYSADRNLTGGLFTSFALILSFAVIIFNKDWKLKMSGKFRIWVIISITVDFLMLLVMMGRYTPVYYFLCKILPWFFLVPYPFYYHFAHHLASILLIALGLNFLVEYKKDLLGRLSTGFIYYYIGFIILFIFIYMISPVPAAKVSAYKILSQYKEWKWFLTHPVLYFVISSVLLVTVYYKRNKNFNLFKYTLFAAVFLEAFYIGYLGFYKNLIMPRPFERSAWEKLQRTHYTLPGKHPFYSQIDELKKISEEYDSRWASETTVLDGLSWAVNGRTLGGYDSKPLITNMRIILSRFYKNFPYHLVGSAYPKKLLSNLNVEHLIRYNSFDDENKIYDYTKDGIDYYLIRSPEMYENKGFKVEWPDYYYAKSYKEPVFKIHKLEKPMPYLYFQNRLYYAGTDEQQIYLYNEDLRKFSLLPYTAKQALPDLKQLPIIGSMTLNQYNTKEQFENLQTENKIIKQDRTHYNRLSLTVEIKDPCLLVRNETYHPDWKVYIDGKEKTLINANFLMQSVYLEKGTHEIIFKFFPKNLKIALFISGFTSIAIILGIIIIIMLNKFLLKKRE